MVGRASNSYSVGFAMILRTQRLMHATPFSMKASCGRIYAFSSSRGAADKAENAGLSQLQITDRPELPPKGTPEANCCGSTVQNHTFQSLRLGTPHSVFFVAGLSRMLVGLSAHQNAFQFTNSIIRPIVLFASASATAQLWVRALSHPQADYWIELDASAITTSTGPTTNDPCGSPTWRPFRESGTGAEHCFLEIAQQ